MLQNFEEEMAVQPDGAQWLPWSLERVALSLGRRFPDRHVWVVRASRMYLHKFSSYHNFVESNMFGAPEHSPYCADSGAFLHLRSASPPLTGYTSNICLDICWWSDWSALLSTCLATWGQQTGFGHTHLNMSIYTPVDSKRFPL